MTQDLPKKLLHKIKGETTRIIWYRGYNKLKPWSNGWTEKVKGKDYHGVHYTGLAEIIDDEIEQVNKVQKLYERRYTRNENSQSC